MEKILVNASSNSIMLKDKTNRRIRRKMKKDLEAIAYLNMQRKLSNICVSKYFLSLNLLYLLYYLAVRFSTIALSVKGYK